MDYDRTPNWNDLNTQFEMGMAQRGEIIAERKARQAQEEANEWRQSVHILRRKFVELSKNAHLTAQNRDAWRRTAEQLWTLAYPNKTKDEVLGLAKAHMERVKAEMPYTGVELSYWDKW